jgi:hypothetical protein
VAAIALPLDGCGLSTVRSGGVATLRVTREFGSQPVSSAHAARLLANETVIDFLERAGTAVQTDYHGRFVASIDGLAESHGAEPRKWFLYVNGVEPPKSPARTLLYGGETVWWDLHDPSQADRVPAVVGSFPEPFTGGMNGRRWPVTVECSQIASSACATVAGRLRALGLPAGISGVAASYEPEILRVVVGPWRTVTDIPGVHQIAAGPRRSGVYARMSDTAGTLTLLDPRGRPTQTLTGDAGLIAAVATSPEAPTLGEAPIWVITGVDEAGVQMAAKAFERRALDGHFAVAVTPAGTIPLPVVS